MSDGFPYADLIFLALVAGFIALRLRSTLGKQVGRDPSQLGSILKEKESRTPPSREKELKAALAREEEAALIAKLDNPTVSSGLVAIKQASPQFNTAEFMGGAKTAFEWVVDAFSKGDKNRLQMLLTPELFRNFAEQLDKNSAEDKKAETTLVSITSQDIVETSLTRNVARVVVKFVSEQIHIMRNAAGEIIEGNASDVILVEDVWTFERDLSSRNPNWKIVDT